MRTFACLFLIFFVIYCVECGYKIKQHRVPKFLEEGEFDKTKVLRAILCLSKSNYTIEYVPKTDEGVLGYPTLVLQDGTEIFHYKTAEKYLARELGFYPGGTELASIVDNIEMIWDHYHAGQTIQNGHNLWFFNRNFASENVEEGLFRFLAKKCDPNFPYFAKSSKITLADIQFYFLVQVIGHDQLAFRDQCMIDAYMNTESKLSSCKNKENL